MQQGNAGTTNTMAQSSPSTQPPAPLINLPGLNEDDSSLNLPPMLRPHRRRRWIILVIVVVLVFLLGAIVVRAAS